MLKIDEILCAEYTTRSQSKCQTIIETVDGIDLKLPSSINGQHIVGFHMTNFILSYSMLRTTLYFE